MNQRPKKRRARSSSSSSSAVAIGLSLSFARFPSAIFAGSGHVDDGGGGGCRWLILAQQRIGDAVDAAATPRRSAVAAVQILNVTHGSRYAAIRAFRLTVGGRTRALQQPADRFDPNEKKDEEIDENQLRLKSDFEIAPVPHLRFRVNMSSIFRLSVDLRCGWHL